MTLNGRSLGNNNPGDDCPIHCPPPPEPLPPLTSAPSTHNGVGVLGVGRWVGRHRVDIGPGKGREGVPLELRGVIYVDCAVLDPRQATLCQIQVV